MAKRDKKAKDKGQQDVPLGERKAGDEIDGAHDAETLHNLSGTVMDGFARLYEIEQEIAAKTERHIAPLREQRKEAWAALRTDSGMQREELAPYFAIYSRARSFDDFEDQNAAAILKDNLRRLYKALPAGETMNFLDAMETVQPGKPEQIKSARQEGYRDFGLGMNFDQCPYQDAVNREAWQAGFLAAKETWDTNAPPAEKPAPPAEATQH